METALLVLGGLAIIGLLYTVYKLNEDPKPKKKPKGDGNPIGDEPKLP